MTILGAAERFVTLDYFSQIETLPRATAALLSMRSPHSVSCPELVCATRYGMGTNTPRLLTTLLTMTGLQRIHRLDGGRANHQLPGHKDEGRQSRCPPRVKAIQMVEQVLYSPLSTIRPTQYTTVAGLHILMRDRASRATHQIVVHGPTPMMVEIPANPLQVSATFKKIEGDCYTKRSPCCTEIRAQ